MTGKQPDQQICEIFFLCLDLIKKRSLMCGFSTQQCKKMLWKAMKNICEVHLNMPADRPEGRGAL